jgi:CheY-like chemotaxis protein
MKPSAALHCSNIYSSDLPEDDPRQDSAKEAPWLQAPKSEDVRKFTVLLVEDDRSDCEEILRMLRKSPYVHNVVTFENGDRLLKHIDETVGQPGGAEPEPGARLGPHAALIMLDISLPGLDGMQILQRLKENPATHGIPVVMITGQASDRKVESAFKLQADAYIEKPVQLQRLHEVLLTGWSWPGTENRGKR